MKRISLVFSLLLLAWSTFSQSTSKSSIYPGEPGNRVFWNKFAERFIYAPAIDIPKVNSAVRYQFIIESTDGSTRQFLADKPWAPLSPVWDAVPEGYTILTVNGLDASGKVIAKAGEKTFYRSPDFSGEVGKPLMAYADAGRAGLKAIYDAPHVQYWLTHDKPDPSYARYCYPNKIIGGLVRGMTAFSKIAEKKEDREAALSIAKKAAGYLLANRFPANSPYAFVPPTYSAKDVLKPVPLSLNPIKNNWFMVPSAVDAAFGFLDLYDATHELKYLDAAGSIASTLIKRQDKDGTWPYMIDHITGKPAVAQRLIPTWVIFLFDRLEKQYKVTSYKASRDRAWNWVVENPLKTYQWDGQFEDVIPRPPYVNLAREQACDVAGLLLDGAQGHPERVAQAEELLRFSEDQFVAWSPVKDPTGWHKAMPSRRNNVAKWITPCVLEQFACYDPVARSSAVLINAYLKAYDVTKKKIYLDKAKALTNALILGQDEMAKTYNTNGEIPTWLMKSKPVNWLNNSFYAAEAILNVAKY